MKKVSILIPTYNRFEKLKLCLNALSKQSVGLDNFEVVVVDDGSTDSTKKCRAYADLLNLNLKYIHQRHAGISVARNRGIKHCDHDIILIIGDDIYAEKMFVEEHIKAHDENRDVAVIGFTDWYPKRKITELMKYLAPDGPQFSYAQIKNKMNCGFNFFYTCNVSLHKKWFENDIFSTKFKKYGYEDLELGYRLERKGLRIVFHEKALAYHDHYMNLNNFISRQKNVGASAAELVKIHAELEKIVLPKLNNKNSIILFVHKFFPFLFFTYFMKKAYWDSLAKKLFLESYFENMK